MSVLDDDLLLEQRVHLGELFDMYSSLLTEKQRTACEMLLRGDLSIAELGEEMGTTRQGAHDLLRRSREFLDDIERKLGLLRLTEMRNEFEGLITENKHNLPAEFVEKAEKILSRTASAKVCDIDA